MATMERASRERASTQDSTVSRFLGRIFAAAGLGGAKDLRRDATLHRTRTPVGDVRRGQMATVRGRIQTVVGGPASGPPTFEVHLSDGSGQLSLVWLGRRHIGGLLPGAVVTATGRIALRHRRTVIYNPPYELDAIP